MLWTYLVGTVVYLLIGVTIGRAGWHVWGRDVNFSRTEKSGDHRWYYYSVQRSWGMCLLFPTTSLKKTLGLEGDNAPFIIFFLDYMFRRLDENRRVIYVALLAAFWPIKVAANTLIILLPLAIGLVQILLWLAYGAMCLPFELIAKTPKRNMELYKRLRPTATVVPREIQDEKMTPELHVASFFQTAKNAERAIHDKFLN